MKDNPYAPWSVAHFFLIPATTALMFVFINPPPNIEQAVADSCIVVLIFFSLAIIGNIIGRRRMRKKSD